MTDEMEDLQVTYPGAGTFMFGDSKKMSDKLIALVRSGKKRANCEALAAFGDDVSSLPVPGRCDIAANWDETPALVIKTRRVEKVRFCDVTEELVLAEGQDDTLEAWQASHKAYFQRNGGFDPEMMLVFEHFDLIEDLADR